MNEAELAQLLAGGGEEVAEEEDGSAQIIDAEGTPSEPHRRQGGGGRCWLCPCAEGTPYDIANRRNFDRQRDFSDDSAIECHRAFKGSRNMRHS